MAKNLSTFAIAQMLHVDPGSVANWIDQGLLKAYRTPGGHRRVVVDDLIHFCRQHGMPVPAEAQARPCRVLIVDDEPAITQLLAGTIKEAFQEFEVIEANDGFRAGQLVATLAPEVVLLDLKMPGVDGYDVCRIIKSNDQTRHARVIAMTAYPSEENVQQITDCGAEVCLEKPLDMDLLLKEISKCL
ncbi:MAG: response regulator [Planctomycetaceae bacterium]|nr:response regulator [Planctomycetaceae bacterium]